MQTFFPVPKSEITPPVTGSWQKVTVPGLPGWATGVVLHLINNKEAQEALDIGLRKNGSIDDRHDAMGHWEHFGAMVGVDGGGTFEAYLEHPDQQIRLIGYTGPGVTFFTNAYHYDQGWGWYDLDLSVICPGAIGVILEGEGSARMKGSTDSRLNTGAYRYWIITGCDENQVIQTHGEVYLVGYITDGAIFFRDGLDISLAEAYRWIDIDITGVCPVGIMAFLQVAGGGGQMYDLAKGGEFGYGYHDSWGTLYAFQEVDENQILRSRITSTAVDLYLVGCAISGEPPPPGTLSVTSVPSGAEVFIDGEFAGKTPLTAELDEREHDVFLALAGYKDYATTVSIIAGEETTVAAILIPVSPVSQSFFPITPVEFSLTTSGAWEDIDVSAHVPVGATGVLLHCLNISETMSWQFGLRKKGSSDSRNSTMHFNNHCWAAIGVDGDRIFQVYGGSYLFIKVILVGYTMAGVTFFTNAIDKSPAGTQAWLDMDCGIEAPDAVGLIFEIYLPSGESNLFGLRKKGSSDDRHGDMYHHNNFGAIIGCDENQVCQGYKEFTAKFFLVGYVTGGAFFNTNAPDYSLPSAGAWLDLSPLPPEAVMGFIEVDTGHPGTAYNFGLRKNGSLENIYKAVRFHTWAFVGCDESGLIEGKVEATGAKFFLTGWAVGPPTGTLAITSTPAGAMAFIDGAPVGTTPLDIELDEGVYDLLLTLAGYQDFATTVSIIAGEETPLAVTLTEVSAEYLLTIAVLGEGTTSPAPGSYPYSEGALAVVTAFPVAGHIFVEWWEDGVPISIDNPISLVMDDDRNVTALFEEVPVVTHTLTIGVAGQGATDPLPGSLAFLDGEIADVTAIPSAGWLFNHWEGDISGAANPVIIPMLSDMSIIAVFSEEVPPEQYALDISVVGQGTTEPPPGTYQIDAGTGVIIKAVPSDGWRFDHWEGDISGTNVQITVVMHQHTSAVAVFTEKLPAEPGLAWYIPAGIIGTIVLAALFIGRRTKR